MVLYMKNTPFVKSRVHLGGRQIATLPQQLSPSSHAVHYTLIGSACQAIM